MSLRRDFASRSRVEWSLRLALAAVVVVAGYFSLALSLGQMIASGDAEAAHRLAPYDGRITAQLAATLSNDGATPKDRARSDDLAKLALRQAPIALSALSTLGMNADLRGDKALARRYFAEAQRVSRRDLRTQLWLIEDAVGRGNVAEALQHYDITLRVHPSAGETLYPVLSSASGDPVILPAIVTTLAARPPWVEGFIMFAARNTSDPRATAMLFNELRRSGVAVPYAASASIVDALIGTHHVDAAWSYFAAIHPGADRHRSRDPRFVAKYDTPSQLDWVAMNDGGLTTSIQDGVFDFSAPATVGGPMLRQLQLLSPGTYRLSGHSAGIEQKAQARPYWALACQDARELGRIEVPDSSFNDGEFSGVFRVPTNCPVQTLVLVARSSDAISGLSGQFDRVELAPIS